MTEERQYYDYPATTLPKVDPTAPSEAATTRIGHIGHEQGKPNRNRVLRLLSALSLVAAGVIGSGAVTGESEPPSALAVYSASGLVDTPDRAVIDEKPQAETHFDEDTLSRSREAVEAWLQGDKAALDGIQEKYGYETGWMEPESLEALETAANFRELERAFGKIMQGTVFELHVVDTEIAALRPSSHFKRAMLTSEDLPNAKATARAVANVLNKLDKRLITSDTQGARAYVALSGDMQRISDGVAVRGAATAMGVEIEVGGQTNNPDAMTQAEVAAHELVHWLDYDTGEKLSGVVSSLNPPLADGDSVYVGTRAPDGNVSTKVGRYKVATVTYGRTNPEEDAATVGADWLEGRSGFMIDRSPLGEKRMGVLFAMEQVCPGAAAAFLKNAQPVPYTESSVDMVRYILGEAGRYWKVSLPASLLLAAFAARRRNPSDGRDVMTADKPTAAAA